MTHQIDQLKEEIQAKESALLKEVLEHQRVDKEKETLKVTFLNYLFPFWESFFPLKQLPSQKQLFSFKVKGSSFLARLIYLMLSSYDTEQIRE